jgi:plasmid replication initiation protein
MDKELTLNKPKPLIYIVGEMTKNKRLIYNYFLTLINEKTANEKGFFFTTISDISTITKIKDYKLLKETLKDLQHTSLHTNILKSERYCSLIGEIQILEENIVKLWFPPTIIDIALMKKDYAKINLYDLANFTSKYSITIYEMIRDYHRQNNSKVQIPDLSIQEFRKLMGVENKLNTNQKLKERILKQAKKDIEEKTDFLFDYEFIKKFGSGRFNHIRLKFKLKEEDLTDDELINGIESTETSNFEKENRIEQLEKEIAEMRKMLKLQSTKANMAIDELDRQHQEKERV